MSTDGRVTLAREYLDTVMSHAVPTLPPMALAREVAELRRHLRGVLVAIEDLEPIEMDESRTQPTLWGRLPVAAPDVDIVLTALSTATLCCELHQPDEVSLAWAARYQQFRQRLESER